LIGAGWTLVCSRGVLRAASAAFLGTALAYLAVGLIHTYHYFWFGPPLWYFENFLFAFHVIFTVTLVVDLTLFVFVKVAPLCRVLRLNGLRMRQVASALMALAIAGGPWFYIRHQKRALTHVSTPYFAPHPQRETPITRILKDEVALRPGGPFR